MSERLIAATILGESTAIREVRALISKVATKNLPVLIQGPTGSGKELVARALHDASGRSGAFVPFNVCAIAEGLFEAALFGQVRGAFTGATASLRGYLVEAHLGTAFLDEISGLDIYLQAKLLRAIETHEFRPVGAREDRKSDFRVVCATNENLDALVSLGRFREDLAHRLRGLVIELAALRDRPEDIGIIARHFAQLGMPYGRKPLEVTDCAVRALTDYSWPGNVRELRQVIERAILLADEGVQKLAASDIFRSLGHAGASRTKTGMPPDCGKRGVLAAALERHGGCARGAALDVGRSRATVYRWKKELGIKGPGSGRHGLNGQPSMENGKVSLSGENSHQSRETL